MATPAFSQAWMRAEPASILTFLPSMVSSTSALLMAEAENGLAVETRDMLDDKYLDNVRDRDNIFEWCE